MIGPPDDLRAWMETRFDRLDDQLDRETRALAEDIKSTRHGLKPLIEQLALQVAETTSRSFENRASIDKINTWRDSDGPLDKRFKRHSARQDAASSWINRMAGALAFIAFMFPVTLAVVLKFA